MKNIKLRKKLLSIFLGGTISLTSLSGCGIDILTNDNDDCSFEIVLDDMTTGTNKFAQDYVNSLGFVDEEFRMAFYKYLADGAGNCFINARQSDVINLELSNVSDLTDLRLFPNLKRVSISDSNIKDFSPLCELENLEYVELSNLSIDCETLSNLKTKSLSFYNVDATNLEMLTHVRNVENMAVYYSHFGNINFVKSWNKLSSLVLCNADISNFNVLSDMELNDLQITFCQVDDWSFLESLEKLKSLDVSYTNFTDFSLLLNLKNLTSLDLSYSLVESLNGISNLKKLSTLSIDSCQSLTNFDEVASLKNLENFDCTNLEMQSNVDSLYTISTNCTNNTIGNNIEVKNKVIKLYDSLGISSEMNDYEKVQIISSTVLDLLAYDTESTTDDIVYYNNNELRSALNGIGRCASYTGLTCALLDLAEIENYSIVGENFEDDEDYLHRWLVVNVEGKWVGLDPTFLDDIDASQDIKNGKDTPYYLDDLSDDVWKEFHYPYFMPDIGQNYEYNLAK